MVADTWLLRMGNQVSSNVKHALLLENSKKLTDKSDGQRGKQFLGILSFEVANVMSMIIHSHKSLTDHEIFKLKSEILNSIGIRTLVSDDETKILELALVEKLDDLNRVASVVSRLGRKCTIPALQGFEHVYGDITAGAIDVKELEFLVKDMEGVIKKMERYVSSTARLYTEMEAMKELEMATVKLKQNHHEETSKAYHQKMAWQKQDVRHLKDVSLWNQTYDKVVELLARTVCTVYARISTVSRDIITRASSDQVGVEEQTGVDSSRPALRNRNGYKQSGPNQRSVGRNQGGGLFGPKDFNFACAAGLIECLTLSSASKHVDEDVSSHISGYSSVPSRFVNGVTSKSSSSSNSARFGPKSKVMFYALPSTVGGSALALHYANIIIVLQKLLQYPHLIGEEARDDLYQMLPESLRKKLKTELKSYMKGLEIYDAPIAYGWRQRLEEILKWLSPLAHNMIRWQSECNYEPQQQVIKRTNVLLIQTLYFADRDKTEKVVCELLVGLNYICRYEQQQTAFLDCTSSLDFEDYKDFQFQIGPSFQA
ncbi:unnamed protein product [Cuscuta europaea]|uniref:DUF668 domain-containing protein n=1 Tax=Cuscuta europaea TaxID=41803 RepID=A0A9P0ZM13_CUSEU|nr:unnamed protein product [Cuscuta europaea]